MPSPSHEENAQQREQNLALILSIQPDESQPMTQFSREQTEAYLWAVKWLHDFNLDRRPKPNFPDETLTRLSDFHEVQMSDQIRHRQAGAPETADDDRPAVPRPSDSLAEWSQRALEGMKRMATDPEHRAAIEKRVS